MRLVSHGLGPTVPLVTALHKFTVALFGTNMAGATDIEFSYTRTGDAFYTMGVAEATEDSASGTTEWDHVPTAENGFLRVVTPSGKSEAFPCMFTT